MTQEEYIVYNQIYQKIDTILANTFSAQQILAILKQCVLLLEPLAEKEKEAQHA